MPFSAYMVFISWTQHGCSGSSHYSNSEREKKREKKKDINNPSLQRQIPKAKQFLLSSKLIIFAFESLKLWIVGNSQHLVDIVLPDKWHDETYPKLDILIPVVLLTRFEIPGRSFNIYDPFFTCKIWKEELNRLFQISKLQSILQWLEDI